MTKIEQLKDWIQSDNIVFFGGAGVSSERYSDLGVPRFRSQGEIRLKT